MSISSMTHAKQVAINLYDGVCCTLHANPGVYSVSNTLPPPERARFAQTAFISVLPRTTTKSPRGTSSEDSENRQ